MNELVIDNLSKTYPNGVEALKNVSLTLKNGMYGLLGPNGAGKSSLMRTIAALQEPSNGEIHFNQVNIISKPDFVRRQLGYLPQEFGVYPKVSAEKLLDHLAVLKGIMDRKVRKQQVQALLHQTNLVQHRKKSVYTFSGGMRQRFGIAQALLGDPKMIIVDEPTAGLDPEERSRFLNLLSEIGENVIVILSTHIVEDVQELCSRMAIMNSGQIIKEGSPNTLVAGIQNKMWSKTISKNALEPHQQQFNVISTKLISGHTQIRVLSEDRPGDGFERTEVNLGDVYFSAISDSSTKKLV